MNSDVDDTISALRERMGAQNDAELARKLRIDKSTISSWRSRKRVPRRFERILEGENHQMIAAPPMGWGDHEKEAFRLALFRFTRLFAETARGDDYVPIVDTFEPNSAAFWLLLGASQEDMMRLMGEYSYTPHDAARRLIYTDFDRPDEAMNRDRKRLESVSISFSKLFDQAE